MASHQPVFDQGAAPYSPAGHHPVRQRLVKVLLTKYKYPPDKQPGAVEKVIEQAELYADLWAVEGA